VLLLVLVSRYDVHRLLVGHVGDALDDATVLLATVGLVIMERDLYLRILKEVKLVLPDLNSLFRISQIYGFDEIWLPFWVMKTRDTSLIRV